MADYPILTELLNLSNLKVVHYQLVRQNRINLFVESTRQIAHCPDCNQASVTLHEVGQPKQFSIRINDQYRICFNWSDRTPTHPGEMLLEEFLNPMGMTQRELADAIHVPYQRVNEIVNGRRGVTPSTALRLAKFFGTSPDFWMNLQLRWDLYQAKSEEKRALETIQPHSHST